MMEHAQYMRMACRLAAKGKGWTSPNPVVGAVIVKGNRVLARGWHRRCGADHAEIAALKQLKGKAQGARMYVTLEPCYHYGRTPPCVEEILKSGISEVFVGMKDPNPLTNGKSIAKLRRAGLVVKVGLLEEQVAALNPEFVKFTKTGMPFIAGKCAQSLDGKIAIARGKSKWITSQESRDYARRIRSRYDAILVGIHTVLKDDPRLSPGRKTKKLKKIILDASLRIPLKARLYQRMDPQDCIVACARQVPLAKSRKLIKKGITLIHCPVRSGMVDLKWLFKELGKRGVTSILIEGGSLVLGSALRDRLVDKMYVYLAPKIFGNKNALSAVEGVETKNVNRAIRLKDWSVRKIGGDMLVEGLIEKNV